MPMNGTVDMRVEIDSHTCGKHSDIQVDSAVAHIIALKAQVLKDRIWVANVALPWII